MESSVTVTSMDEAAQTQSPDHHRPRGGSGVAFPFIIGTMACLTLAAGGWINNLIVYLIQEFNMKSISAAKIFNFVNGSVTLFPIVGAVIADSFVGCFTVIWFTSLVSVLGVLLMVLTAAIDQLRPPACENGSNLCRYPTGLQFAVLYLGLALASLGTAGTRFTLATIGADQFESPKHQAVFFNWYIFTMYVATVISSTAIVYIEDNVSWTVGFALCAVANVLGLAVFLCGTGFYRLVMPQGSPFKSLTHVVVGSFSKRRMALSEKGEDYYHDANEDAKKTPVANPTHFFRFLNRAALRIDDDDTARDGCVAKSWKKCTVQQVEDLKSLKKMLPLWSTGLFLCTPLAIQLSLAIIQALSMDRHLTSHFKVPAGSMPVFILVSTSLCILVADRFLFHFWEKFTRRPLTLLQRVGIGHAITIISMAISAMVESRRLSVARSRNLLNQTNAIVPMSVFWLVPQLAAAGIGEALHFPAQMALYYQDFPESLKSTATAAVAVFIGIAFYISNAIIDLVERATGWIPDDINKGRLDNVYWLCCIVGGMNFMYYLTCASMYKYQNVKTPADGCDKS